MKRTPASIPDMPDGPPLLFEGFSKETARFLHGLKKNNNKAWFEAHRDDYEMYLRDPSKALAESMGDYFREHDMPVTGNAKASLFRINRDIRFSADKSPYKTHVGLSFPLEGTKKEEWCGFYFGMEPAATGTGLKVFAGGGVYMPMPPYLKRIRARIDSEYPAFTAALHGEDMRRAFPSGLTGDTLKRIPKGYAEDNPAAEWLKLKSFLFNNVLPGSRLLDDNLPEVLGAQFAAALPIVRFLGGA